MTCYYFDYFTVKQLGDQDQPTMAEENESRKSDDYTLRVEAQEALKEVSFAVSHVELSIKLPQGVEKVYLNIRTQENDVYCIELSVQGFRIVGRAYDVIDEAAQGRHYETIYALLDEVSPKYRNSFGDTLLRKLEHLQKQTEDTS
ncbi:GSK3-beta interaction protein-like [Saccostrea echinata]|uniref:GSK3-beta interaction protein-like n=1 Tax=Saccostrea echinata TaxID=191078 RepID=UPI002A7F7C41|nr:GSK3-beta interaction protein-like [Saccostrea echinata]